MMILAINPGSTSTKYAVFKGSQPLLKETVYHEDAVLLDFSNVIEQLPYRLECLQKNLSDNAIDLGRLDAIVGRGGFLKPLPGGTYRVDEAMLDDLQTLRYGEHASNLGALLAHRLAEPLGIPSFIVDPVVVDEFEPNARYSGIPDIQRTSQLHALNIKAVSRKVAADLGKTPADLNFIVAHLGGGISVAALRKGRIIDVNNAINEGPFSPERAGGLPSLQLVKLCFSGRYTEPELLAKLTRTSGLYAYLGTKNAQEVVDRITQGDDRAREVLDAMIHQIAKEIGAMAAVLDGAVDGIIFTGGISHSAYIVERLRKKVHFLGPIHLVPGEEELKALAQGALRVLTGEESAKNYHSS